MCKPPLIRVVIKPMTSIGIIVLNIQMCSFGRSHLERCFLGGKDKADLIKTSLNELEPSLQVLLTIAQCYQLMQ